MITILFQIAVLFLIPVCAGLFMASWETLLGAPVALP